MTQTNGQPDSNTPGRDASGRFLPGCRPGPGRPGRESEVEYLRAFQRGLPLEKLTEIVEAMVTKAISGNVPAATLLFKHALPQIGLRLELSNEDVEEFRVAGQTASQVNESMIAHISKRLYERREYEAQVAAQQAATKEE